jgi:hypothetical protein
MISQEILGFVLAIAFGAAGPVTTVLFKTGEISAKGNKHPLAIMSFTALHGVNLALLVFYIFWVFLNWTHIVVLIISQLTIGELLYKKIRSTSGLWLASTFAAFIVAICEVLLITATY